MMHLEAIVERNKGTVEITVEEYEQLQKDADTLAKLEAAGVDNWEGYSFAFQDDDEDDTEA